MLPLHKRRTQFRYVRIELDLDISHGGATRWLLVRCKHVFTAGQHTRFRRTARLWNHV
jgi:hypothetical protein